LLGDGVRAEGDGERSPADRRSCKTDGFDPTLGLSYTTYTYSELKTTSDNGLTVTFKVKNTGNRAGEETAQVYLTLPASVHEPPRRLVG